ncbi:hypothetical protein IV203_035317 [Nitzschia inconspicua]|uniref:Uncharacterized protein n=1 Tax=Nitzschia inconspicua TaxID=303405 RepID=A0A9K3LDU2_9STRA|nr:hypothetical protein IV203_035317 [Nitzschia inconspicua]
MSSRGANSKKKLDKESRKKLLIELVKNEMMSALDGLHEEGEESSARSLTPSVNDDLQNRISSADMFYAMMNGEPLLTSPPKVLKGSVDGCPAYGMNDDKTEFTFDQTSFANLVFSPDDMTSPVSQRPSTSKIPKRKSLDCNSLALTKSIDESLDLSLGDEESSRSSQPSQPVSYPSETNSQSSTMVGSDGLSVREIEAFVVANIPQHVRDQIPQEAWGRIFGRTESQGTIESKFDYDQMITREELHEPEDDSDDNITSVSDITDPTQLHLESSSSFLSPDSPGNRRETRWESDDSPLELTPTGWCSDSHSETENPAAIEVSRNRVTFAGEVQSVVKTERTIKEDASKVSFNNVQVRYYERILEINPAVTSGAAIGIGWRYKRGGSLSIDEWEHRRGQLRRPNELLLPKNVRESMLKDLGYSQQDIAAAIRHILKSKNRRKQTVDNLGAEPMEEVVESARRRVMSILTLGMKKGLVKTAKASS